MKNTVEASIIAVASQKETPTMSSDSSIPLFNSADTFPIARSDSVPTNIRLDVLVRLDLIIKLRSNTPYIKECIFSCQNLTILAPI